MRTSAALAAVLALLAALAWYAAAGRGSAGAGGKTPPPVPVTVAPATTGEIPVLLDLIGRAEAYESVAVKARVDGQVASVAYVEGQRVKRGDVLVRLDPADFAARLAQAEANLARDRAQLAKSTADVERYTSLKARGFVSDEKVNEVRTAQAAAAAAVKADEAAAELARLQMSYAVVRAPIGGVVGARQVSPGAAVKINDSTLAVVNRVQPLYAAFAVPERHLPSLRRALATGPLAVQVTVPGSREAPLPGRAHFIDNTVDATTGTIQMKALLENREEKLTPGQYLNVSMQLDRLTNAVLVPGEAIQQGSDGNFVYVVSGDGKAEFRKVEILASHRGVTAIGKGVAAGETVVVDGQLRLVPGAAVRAVVPGAPKAATESKASQ